MSDGHRYIIQFAARQFDHAQGAYWALIGDQRNVYGYQSLVLVTKVPYMAHLACLYNACVTLSKANRFQDPEIVIKNDDRQMLLNLKDNDLPPLPPEGEEWWKTVKGVLSTYSTVKWRIISPDFNKPCIQSAIKKYDDWLVKKEEPVTGQ